MSAGKSNRFVVVAVVAMTLAAIGLNLAGWAGWHQLWVLKAWQYTPIWYLVVWGCLSAGLILFIWKNSSSVARAIEAPRATGIAIVGIVAIIALFHFDSFVAGGGNLRIAQIAQSEHVVVHWYEFGTIGITTLLFKTLSLLGVASNTAGVWAWRVFSFGLGLLSLLGAARLARLIGGTRQTDIAALVIIVFGGPLLMFLGYVGMEPLIVAATIWFSVAAWQYISSRTVLNFAALWGVIAVVCVMHIQCAFLIAPGVCVTVAALLKSKSNWKIGGAVGGTLALGSAALLHKIASSSPGLAQYLILPGGKLPMVDYTLFSTSAVMDNMQVTLAVAPLALLILWLVFVRLQTLNDKVFAITIMIAVISGRVLIRVLDPINGIVLDFPRLTAYLAPLAIGLAFCLHRVLQLKKVTPRFYLMCAAITVVMPLSIVPTFTKIEWTDPLAKGLAEKTDFYYRRTGLSFRDAYFYRKQLDRANAWEWSLPVKSPDFLNMRGCSDLVANNQVQDALVSLYRLVGRQPYWAEPRALLAAVLLNQGRIADAKFQIDTCSMLDPDVKSHKINHYRYLQLTGSTDSAFVMAELAGKQFPSDNDIASDLLVYSFQLKKAELLDSLARVVLLRQPKAPSAHLVLARLADQKGLVDSARNEYTKFVQNAPANDPDIEPAIRRIEVLRKSQEN